MSENGKTTKFTPKFKAETVLEILREQKPMNQIASERSLHPNQLTNWKKIAIEGLPQLFERGDKQGNEIEQLKSEHEKQVEELYAQIGKLTTQLNWLKKIWSFH